MRSARKTLIFLLILVLCLGIALLVYKRMGGPPRAVLLLPEGDLLVYIDFKPLRVFHGTQNLAAGVAPDYQDFVRNTGFQFETDLDEIAISQRDPDGLDSESSSIFGGRFDRERLTGYLKKISSSSEEYRGRTIFAVQQPNHVVRVCILSNDRVAVSNSRSADAMHAMVDNSEKFFLRPQGPALLKPYYSQLPAGSIAWLMYRNSSPADKPASPGTMGLDFLNGTTSVASLRYSGSLLLLAEIISDTTAHATRVADALTGLIALAHGASESLGHSGTDPDVKAAFESLHLQQEDTRVIVTADIPEGFVRKALKEDAQDTSTPPAHH